VVGQFECNSLWARLTSGSDRRSPCHITNMATRRLKRPRDPIQLGKLIVDIATEQIEDSVDDGRDSAAADLGRRGGKARAANLSPEQRSEIARKAAQRRWSRDP
jgi:hypothetical protein